MVGKRGDGHGDGPLDCDAIRYGKGLFGVNSDSLRLRIGAVARGYFDSRIIAGPFTGGLKVLIQHISVRTGVAIAIFRTTEEAVSAIASTAVV